MLFECEAYFLRMSYDSHIAFADERDRVLGVLPSSREKKFAEVPCLD